MSVKIAPPEQELRGRRLAEIAVSGRETSNAPHSVATRGSSGNSHHHSGRSLVYACWYRVGVTKKTHRRAYWHPAQVGYGIEMDVRDGVLVQWDGEPIDFFPADEDYWRMAEDVRVNSRILDAMPDELFVAYEDAARDAQSRRLADWYDDLAHERVYAHVWPTGVF